MNSTFKRAAAAVCGTLALCTVHTSASALTTVPASASCKPYGDGSAGDHVFASASGLHNRTGERAKILCPVVRSQEPGPDGFSVYVDGDAAQGTARCTLYSRSDMGVLMGSTTASITGNFSEKLTLPQEQVPKYSSQTLLCSLPPSGLIRAVESNLDEATAALAASGAGR